MEGCALQNKRERTVAEQFQLVMIHEAAMTDRCCGQKKYRKTCTCRDPILLGVMEGFSVRNIIRKETHTVRLLGRLVYKDIKREKKKANDVCIKTLT
jgi:hypothetical protein